MLVASPPPQQDLSFTPSSDINKSTDFSSKAIDSFARNFLNQSFSKAQTFYLDTKGAVYSSVTKAYEALGNRINAAIDRVNIFTRDARNTLYQAAAALHHSDAALATDNPVEIGAALASLDAQIDAVAEQLDQTNDCYLHNAHLNKDVRQMRGGESSYRLNAGQRQLEQNAGALRNALGDLLNQRAALTERLEILAPREMPQQDAIGELLLIVLDYIDDALMGDFDATMLQSNASFINKEASPSLLSQNQETHQNCQTLLAKEQYQQLTKEAQKLPESLKTDICKQLLQAPVKEAALAAAKELLPSLSNQGQIYCKCLIALAEGKIQQMLELTKTLSDNGKMTLVSQLIAQGNLAEAEKVIQTMKQGAEKNYALCTLFMAQGKDALVILQAQQTKLPDGYQAQLCEKFIAAGKPAEAMLLAGMIKNPALLQSLCQAFLSAGFLQEAVELAKNLPPEMQLALASMLLEAGCLQEAMELGMHMPMEQQTALFQMLLQKNPSAALQFAAKILQNPEQAKQLIQMLMNKGFLAEAKLLLKLANNPQLDKEFASLLAQEEAKKNKRTSAAGCENEESFSEEDDQEKKEDSDSEEEEEEEEESDDEKAESLKETLSSEE